MCKFLFKCLIFFAAPNFLLLSVCNITTRETPYLNTVIVIMAENIEVQKLPISLQICAFKLPNWCVVSYLSAWFACRTVLLLAVSKDHQYLKLIIILSYVFHEISRQQSFSHWFLDQICPLDMSHFCSTQDDLRICNTRRVPLTWINSLHKEMAGIKTRSCFLCPSLIRNLSQPNNTSGSVSCPEGKFVNQIVFIYHRLINRLLRQIATWAGEIFSQICSLSYCLWYLDLDYLGIMLPFLVVCIENR